MPLGALHEATMQIMNKGKKQAQSDKEEGRSEEGNLLRGGVGFGGCSKEGRHSPTTHMNYKLIATVKAKHRHVRR